MKAVRRRQLVCNMVVATKIELTGSERKGGKINPTRQMPSAIS